MSEITDDRPNIDALVAELRSRVEERRRRGEYPAGLDEELERHWQAVSAAMPPSGLQQRLRDLDIAGDFDRGRIPLDSGFPLGTYAHRLVAKATTRQINGVIMQMREYADAIRAMFEALLEAVLTAREASGAILPRLEARLEALEDDVAAIRRVASDDTPAAGLAARIEPLERARAAAGFSPWFNRDDFEAEFRGDRERILESYRPLAARFQGFAPVVDVGCGYGIVLELFRELGIEATGVDIDDDFVASCVARGLRAEAGDGVAYLESLGDHSLGGIFSAQVVEHLQAQELLNFVAVASQKLREDGLLIVETVNSQSLYVYAHAYPIDPTHVRPVPPAYLDFLLRQAGFREVYIEWRNPVGDDDRLEPVDLGEDLAVANAQLTRNLDRLQRLVYGEQDYAVIGRR